MQQGGSFHPKDRHERRGRRHTRVRKKVRGTAERPRLCVYRSLHHIYAQVVDDDSGTTVASVSSVSPGFRKEMTYGGNRAAAKLVGRLIAEQSAEKGVRRVVFDRGGYLYHGRVKDLAEAAREAGLEF